MIVIDALTQVISTSFKKEGLRGFQVEIRRNVHNDKFGLFFYKLYDNFCSYHDLQNIDKVAANLRQVISETIEHPEPQRSVRIEKTMRVSTRYWVSSPRYGIKK